MTRSESANLQSALDSLRGYIDAASSVLSGGDESLWLDTFCYDTNDELLSVLKQSYPSIEFNEESFQERTADNFTRSIQSLIRTMDHDWSLASTPQTSVILGGIVNALQQDILSRINDVIDTKNSTILRLCDNYQTMMPHWGDFLFVLRNSRSNRVMVVCGGTED